MLHVIEVYAVEWRDESTPRPNSFPVRGFLDGVWARKSEKKEAGSVRPVNSRRYRSQTTVSAVDEHEKTSLDASGFDYCGSEIRFLTSASGKSFPQHHRPKGPTDPAPPGPVSAPAVINTAACIPTTGKLLNLSTVHAQRPVYALERSWREVIYFVNYFNKRAPIRYVRTSIRARTSMDVHIHI